MSRAEQKLATLKRILDAAGRGFRRGGYDGIGVDGLAREAGVTSGAFYVHFPSKAAAFKAAVDLGMEDLRNGVAFFQTTYGAAWWPEFVKFYLGAKRECDLAESCALQSLSPEVARSDAASRTAFEQHLHEIAQVIAAGPSSPGAPSTPEAALGALATLAGAVTIARAAHSEVLSQQVAAAAQALLLAGPAEAGSSPQPSQRAGRASSSAPTESTRRTEKSAAPTARRSARSAANGTKSKQKARRD